VYIEKHQRSLIMSDFMSKTMASILSNGIALNLESEEEEQHYVMKMLDYFTDETEFPAYLRKPHILEIENDNLQLAMEIIVQQSTMYLLPYGEEVFEIFTEVLKFIATKHMEVVSDFRGVEQTKIESISEVESKNNEEKEERQEPPDDDDDYEWI
jgi:hypothetical protein